MIKFLQNLDILGILKTGAVGFGFLLAVLSFYLIFLERQRSEPRNKILYINVVYMLFSLAIFSLGINAYFNSPESNITKEKTQSHVDKIIVDSNFVETRPTEQALLDTSSGQNRNNIYNDLNEFNDFELWEFIDQNKESISRLEVSGAHLQNGVGMIRTAVDEILKKGGLIRVALTNPLDSNSVYFQSERKSPRTDSENIVGLINTSIRDLSQIVNSNETPGDLVLHLVPYPLDERIHKIVLNNGETHLFVKLYPFKHLKYQGVANGGLYFKLSKTVGEENFVFDYYAKKLQNYFAFGKRVDLSSV